MDKNVKAESPNILAVEGKDECNFFAALCRYMGLRDIQIIDIGGKDKFKVNFPLLANSERFYNIVKNIGFVRDAEDREAASAFQSICNILKSYKLPCPLKPNKAVHENGRNVSIFVMPNNLTSGMLEDLCIKSKENDPVWACVESFLMCYQPKITQERYSPSKAGILAYLSTRVPIVNELGLAAQQGIWEFDNPCFDSVNFFCGICSQTKFNAPGLR
jgi:hypothetical protein